MKKQIKKIVNNQRGSALAFVLIVGMVLTILLGSLIALAERGIFKTQSSLESRQDYADAKSVIEFGKIYINQDIDTKFKETSDYEEPEGENTKGDDIFYIIGHRKDEPIVPDAPDNPLNPLKLSMEKNPPADDSLVLGVCNLSWKKTVSSGGTMEEQRNYSKSKEYTYKIVTQNMRRKMDFKTIFMHIVQVAENGMPLNPPGIGFSIEDKEYIIQTDPEERKPITPQKTIEEGGRNLKLKDCAYGGKGELTVKAENISGSSGIFNNSGKSINIEATDTAYFNGNFTLQNKDAVTKIQGENVVIKGNLKLIKGARLNIKAENLWIDGTITLEEGSTLNIGGMEELGKIKPIKQVIINEKNKGSDTNTFAKDSTFSLSGKEAWIYGSIKAIGASIQFSDVNYLQVGVADAIQKKIMPGTGKISLTGAEFSITGDPSPLPKVVNQIYLGELSEIKDKEETKRVSQITTSRLTNLIANKIDLNNCVINLAAEFIKVNGDLGILGEPGNMTEIKANTFVCTENVSFKGKNGAEAKIAIDSVNSKSLNLWFQGNYLQETPVTISDGDKVAFGKNWGRTFKIAATGADLVINSKEIFFYSSIENILSKISYNNPLGKTETITLNLQREIRAGVLDVKVEPGKYANVVSGFNFLNLVGVKPEKVDLDPNKNPPFAIPGENTVETVVGATGKTGNVEEVTTEYYLPEAEKSTP